MTEADAPIITVIINCYNGCKYLKQAIDSVMAQTYRKWELIFWDNRSTDSSADIFRSYFDARLTYFLADEHTSLGEARNLAVQRARGTWIGFLDCDDIWLPHKLEAQVSILLNSSSEVGMVYGQMLVICEPGNGVSGWGRSMTKYSSRTLLAQLPQGLIFTQLLCMNFIPLPTALMKRQLYTAIGGISDHLGVSEDYELFLKASRVCEVRAVQDTIALYRVHQTNTTSKNLVKCHCENLSIISSFLPDPYALRGIRYHETTYSIALVKSGRIFEGVRHFLINGNIDSLLSVVYSKIFRKLR